MKINITKDEFINQLNMMDARFQKQEYIEQAIRDWDLLTESAQSAVLYLKGVNTTFNCHMASVNETGFFNTYLPISPAFVRK